MIRAIAPQIDFSSKGRSALLRRFCPILGSISIRAQSPKPVGLRETGASVAVIAAATDVDVHSTSATSSGSMTCHGFWPPLHSTLSLW